MFKKHWMILVPGSGSIDSNVIAGLYYGNDGARNHTCFYDAKGNNSGIYGAGGTTPAAPASTAAKAPLRLKSPTISQRKGLWRPPGLSGG